MLARQQVQLVLGLEVLHAHGAAVVDHPIAAEALARRCGGRSSVHGSGSGQVDHIAGTAATATGVADFLQASFLVCRGGLQRKVCKKLSPNAH